MTLTATVTKVSAVQGTSGQVAARNIAIVAKMAAMTRAVLKITAPTQYPGSRSNL